MNQHFVNYLAGRAERAFEIQAALTAVPALGPENGGQGELDKAAVVEGLLAACGFNDIIWINSPDSRVASGLRPNIVARLAGRSARTLWLFGHLDVVPPGAGWRTDPWRAVREDGFVYGRGVEDNQQAITSMLLLAESLRREGITPNLGLGLVFMSDEECGSRHGLRHILKQAPELFGGEDYYIVPDGGSADAKAIEIAEKAQLWLRFTTHGRQCHASAPSHGANAFVAASRLVLNLGGLASVFTVKNSLFDPSVSTFTPTRHDGNACAINILPGSDVFYMDCRLLPETPRDAALARIREIVARTARETGLETDMEIVHSQAATATPADAPVVAALERAVKAVYGVDASPCGIGGATVAAFLREAGLPAVVWSCIQNTCHQPNERSSLSATCRDAAVFAHVLCNGVRHV